MRPAGSGDPPPDLPPVTPLVMAPLRRRPAASERLRDLIGDRAELLGFDPSLEIDGEIDDLPTDLADDLIAAIGEALSNATRHARAHTVSVLVQRRDRSVCMRVADDGVGMPADPQPGHGLSNLLWRAANHGGRCTWTPRDGGGTVVQWQIRPIRGVSAQAARGLRHPTWPKRDPTVLERLTCIPVARPKEWRRAMVGGQVPRDIR